MNNDIKVVMSRTGPFRWNWMTSKMELRNLNEMFSIFRVVLVLIKPVCIIN